MCVSFSSISTAITDFSPCSVISSDQLAEIGERLPEEMKGDMERVFRKRLEFEFHPAGYHVMLATTTGLRTAAGYLVKVWCICV